MKTKKKLIIAVAAIAILLLIAIATLIIVLASTSLTASSKVNMSYTVEGVNVRVSGNAYVGTTEYSFMTGANNTYVDLSENVTSATLSHSQLTLSYDNPKIVYEFVFANLTNSKDAKISLAGIPATSTNMNLSYAVSDVEVSDFSTLNMSELKTSSSAFAASKFATQTLEKGTGNVVYVYIEVAIADVNQNAALKGNFNWSLTS